MRLHTHRRGAKVGYRDSAPVDAAANFKAERRILRSHQRLRHRRDLRLLDRTSGCWRLLLDDPLLYGRRCRSLPEKDRPRWQRCVRCAERDDVNMTGALPCTTTLREDSPEEDRQKYDEDGSGCSDRELYSAIPQRAVFCR